MTSGRELNPLIDRFLNFLMVEKGLAKATLEAYSRDLLAYAEFLERNGVPAVSEEDGALILKHLIDLRRTKLGARSRARHLVAVRGFYRFLAREGILALDPSKLVDMPKTSLKLPDVLTVDEVRRLLNAPNSGRASGVRDAAMLELLYAAGLRVSELVGLKVQDAHLDGGFVRVLGKGPRSGSCRSGSTPGTGSPSTSTRPAGGWPACTKAGTCSWPGPVAP